MKRHIGMPKPIGAFKGQPSIVIGIDAAGLVQIALIDDFEMGDAVLITAAGRQHRLGFHRPKQATERNVLFVGQRCVVANNGDGIAVQNGFQFLNVVRSKLLPQIYAVYLRSKTLSYLPGDLGEGGVTPVAAVCRPDPSDTVLSTYRNVRTRRG